MVSASSGHKQLICLGEALVDLICPEPLAVGAEPSSFEVHCGGALSNVAVAARRAGAPVALASGCGDDRWGRLLRARLRAEDVDLRFYGVVEGVPTPFAFAFLDESREPAFEIHGEGIDAAIASLAGREAEIAESAAAVVFGSNTLVDQRSRDVTTAVCKRSAELDAPVLFDPNVRPGRWNDLAEARERCLPFLAMANVLKCNAVEARWLLGEEGIEPGLAAEALHDLGPDLVIVTAGTDPAVTRGAYSAEVRPQQVDLVSPLGAGDAFMGTFAAGLHSVGFDLGRAGEALREAVEAGARTCTHLGAFDR